MKKNDYFIDLPIKLDQLQYLQFEKYYELLIQWSKIMNLTSILDEKGIYLKHFYDSLALSKVYQFNDERLVDIGSGAGFPGIPLKICFPNLKVTLVEPTLKRVRFLEEVINSLCLKDIICLSKRAEELTDLKETFDVVTSRAVASLPVLLELSIPLLKIDGYMLAMKGSNFEEELKKASHVLEVLGCVVEEIISFDLPANVGSRTIIKIKKQKKTDSKYPRSFAQIKRNSL